LLILLGSEDGFKSRKADSLRGKVVGADSETVGETGDVIGGRAARDIEEFLGRDVSRLGFTDRGDREGRLLRPPFVGR
jgi:hypothetical protein